MNAESHETAAETLDLATMLKMLKTTHLLAKQQLNMAHDRFIQHMPPNVLSKVLMMDESNHSALTDGARPLVLASVSRAWRSAIFAVPQIWTKMRIHRRQSYWSFPRDLVEAWLARSGELPLRVTLSWTTPLSHDQALPLQRIGALLQLIQKESHRLESFHLDVPTAVLTLLTREATPLLHSFHLAVGEVDVACTNINFSLLTEVHIKTGLDTLETLEFFRLCPNLVRCDLCIQNLYIQPLPEQLPSTPIVLPKLQRLRLELLMDNPGDIVDWINLPRLDYFHLVMLQTRFHAPSYAAMIERSGCAPRSFTYENGYVKADEDISVLLNAMPTLRSLFLKVNNKYSDTPLDLHGPLFSRLVSPNPQSAVASEQTFLPALRKFLYCGPIPFSWSQYASLCEAHSEQRTCPSWIRIRIHVTAFVSTIDQDTQHRLMALPQETRDVIQLTPKALLEAAPPLD